MSKINLVDTAFKHIEYSAPGIVSDNIRWNRIPDNPVVDAPTFYTHEQIFGDLIENGRDKYAWLIESQAIIPGIYTRLLTDTETAKKFKYIFTHSSYLLSKYNHARWIPGGSIWVGGTYGGGEKSIRPKTRLCSMVSSDKKMCRLHELRIAIVNFLRDQEAEVDFFGSLFGVTRWVPIIDSLRDYMFSIVIENYVDHNYFTEKLLNCFATGTIPIYMGAKNIASHFNPEGILQFQKPGELIDILGEFAKPKYYEAKMEAIKENFQLCQKYRLMEDFILGTYL